MLKTLSVAIFDVKELSRFSLANDVTAISMEATAVSAAWHNVNSRITYAGEFFTCINISKPEQRSPHIIDLKLIKS